MKFDFDIREIPSKELDDFITKWHYSASLPRLTRIYLGGFVDGRLVAAMSLGWGSRPHHTIAKLFPGLSTPDYFEIGRMALEDDMPRNSETQFLSAVISWIKLNRPKIKILFTWADGMWGKPGYVYQAANFLYGGYIETDAYIDENGQKLHPLQLAAERRRRGLPVTKRTQRPNFAEQQTNGWQHVFGYQLRYVYFLGSKKESKELLKISTVEWNRKYPKYNDLKWRKQAGEGSRVNCEAPSFKRSARFRHPAPNLDAIDSFFV